MKLKANEYCACIGFYEDKAVIDKRAARKYKGYDVSRFLREGLYKQAFSLAYYKQDKPQINEVLQSLQAQIERQGEPLPGRRGPQSTDDLIRLFGNIPAPKNLGGIMYV